jgi:hypothetical protein
MWFVGQVIFEILNSFNLKGQTLHWWSQVYSLAVRQVYKEEL